MSSIMKMADYILASVLMFYLPGVVICNQSNRVLFSNAKEELNAYGSLICKQGYITEDVKNYIEQKIGGERFCGVIKADHCDISLQEEKWKDYLGVKVYPLNTDDKLEIVLTEKKDWIEELLFFPINLCVESRSCIYEGRIRDGIYERGGIAQ